MSRLTRGMRITLVAVGAVVAVGLALSVWALTSTSGAPAAGGAPVATQSSAGATAGADATKPAAGKASGGSESAKPKSPGPLPEATPVSGSEVLPPTATPQVTLPPVKATAQPKKTKTDKPLVSSPLPKSSNKSGALAAGLPSGAMGPVPGSVVVSSSIVSHGNTMQAALVARTTASHQAITQYYEKLWSSAGLHKLPATGSSALSYKNAYTTMTLSFGSTGTGNRYSVVGILRTK